MKRSCALLSALVFLTACVNLPLVRAQAKPAAVNVAITRTESAKVKANPNLISDASNVVVWLVPLDRLPASSSGPSSFAKPPKLVQLHKTFDPHVLVVPVGTRVEFPNKDPFFHNIFSLYDGKRFDLGLYEAGTTRSVLFDRPGVSFLFCNIHSEMSAVVVAVDTPYFGLSDRSGNVIIPNIPDGRYQLNVWYERSSPENLKELTRLVTISDSARNLGTVRILENSNFTPTHKNKYGLDYIPPASPDYSRP